MLEKPTHPSERELEKKPIHPILILFGLIFLIGGGIRDVKTGVVNVICILAFFVAFYAVRFLINLF